MLNYHCDHRRFDSVNQALYLQKQLDLDKISSNLEKSGKILWNAHKTLANHKTPKDFKVH